MLKSEQGQALVELALILPILFLLLMGIIEFGRVFNAYITVSHVSREAARVAALGSSDSKVQALALERAGGLDASRLKTEVKPDYAERGRGVPVEVKIDYEVPLVVPIVANLLPNPFPLTAKTVMRME